MLEPRFNFIQLLASILEGIDPSHSNIHLLADATLKPMEILITAANKFQLSPDPSHSPQSQSQAASPSSILEILISASYQGNSGAGASGGKGFMES